MDDIIRIAVDGPAGAGKSTIAKNVAAQLGIDYIDTGAMYRAIGLKLLRTGIDMHEDGALAAMLETTDIDYAAGRTYLDGEDVSDVIRTPQISAMASDCSAILAVREKLVAIQQAMGKRKSIIMDGRDIGTVVLPDAQYKFYLTASSDVRAARRCLELEQKGLSADFEEIRASIEARDHQDMHREHSPLMKAGDAIEVDSSDMDIDEVVERFLQVIRG